MNAARRPMPGRSWLGFAAPASRRVAVALVYTATAFGVVAWVEATATPRRTTTGVDQAESTPASAIQQPIAIKSTCAIQRWTVRLDGREIAAERSDAQSWSGVATLSSSDSADLFLDIAATADASTPAAVRVTIGDGTSRRERTWWFDETGTVTQRWSLVPAAQSNEDAP